MLCRYAQQARTIINVARVNEDPNVKMVRGTIQIVMIAAFDLCSSTELTNEINQLRDLLAMQGGEEGLTELRQLREQLSESEKLLAEANRCVCV